jgi:hypothetical protein
LRIVLDDRHVVRAGSRAQRRELGPLLGGRTRRECRHGIGAEILREIESGVRRRHARRAPRPTH